MGVAMVRQPGRTAKVERPPRVKAVKMVPMRFMLSSGLGAFVLCGNYIALDLDKAKIGRPIKVSVVLGNAKGFLEKDRLTIQPLREKFRR